MKKREWGEREREREREGKGWEEAKENQQQQQKKIKDRVLERQQGLCLRERGKHEEEEEEEEGFLRFVKETPVTERKLRRASNVGAGHKRARRCCPAFHNRPYCSTT